MGRLESRRSTRYQCPSSSPSMVAPRNRAPVSRASAPRAGTAASGQPATSPGTTAAIPTQRAAGARAYSSTCQTARRRRTPQPEGGHAAGGPGGGQLAPAGQPGQHRAGQPAPASLKNPGRTTPHSGASQSRARPPSAVSYRTTVSTPAGPCTVRRPPRAPRGVRGSVAPPAHPSGGTRLGVDDLAGDPGRLVGAEPGDQPGGVVGRAPAAGREPRPPARGPAGRRSRCRSGRGSPCSR